MPSWFYKAGRVVLLAAAFGLIFCSSTLILAGIFSLIWDVPLIHGPTLLTAEAFSLLGLLLAAWVYLRKVQMVLPVGQPELFLEKLKIILHELGYEFLGHSSRHLATRPGFKSFLPGGGIHVHLDGQQVRIAGPKVAIAVLRGRIRLQNHLEKALEQRLEHRRALADRLLKRVQLSFKCEPEQLSEVHQNVVRPLAREGHVVCLLNLFVQSDRGIREGTVEHQIREWLDKNDIELDVHRDHIELPDHSSQLLPALMLAEPASAS